MVFKATFNNISVISWLSVILVEETGESHQPVAGHWKSRSCLKLWPIKKNIDTNLMYALMIMLINYVVYTVR